MLEWLELNKQWVLSGAGVAIITSIVAIASSLITLVIKIRSERKGLKRMTFSTKLNLYQIENDERSDDLAVSYQGQPYANLCQYLITIKNSGQVAIEGQQLLLKFPEGSIILDFALNRSSNIINNERNILNESGVREELHTISRLEQPDTLTYSYIINTTAPNSIVCQPRGVDGAKYIFSGLEEEVPEFRKLILFLVIFLLIGNIPIVGGMLQILVIIAASQTIVRVYEEWRDRHLKEKSMSINKIKIEGDGRLSIVQS